jgi:hypothetical protein
MEYLSFMYEEEGLENIDLHLERFFPNRESLFELVTFLSITKNDELMLFIRPLLYKSFSNMLTCWFFNCVLLKLLYRPLPFIILPIFLIIYRNNPLKIFRVLILTSLLPHSNPILLEESLISAASNLAFNAKPQTFSLMQQLEYTDSNRTMNHLHASRLLDVSAMKHSLCYLPKTSEFNQKLAISFSELTPIKVRDLGFGRKMLMDYGHLGAFSLEYATSGLILMDLGYNIKPAPYSNGHAAEFFAINDDGKHFFVEMKTAASNLHTRGHFLNKLLYEKDNLNSENVLLVVDFANKPSLLRKAGLKLENDGIYAIHTGNLNYRINNETYQLIRDSIAKQLGINEEIYENLPRKEKIELHQAKLGADRFEYFKNKFKVGV